MHRLSIHFWYNTIRYLFSKNIQGDIVSLLNEDGTLVATYVYDAYGNHKVYGNNGQENTEASFVGNPVKTLIIRNPLYLQLR